VSVPSIDSSSGGFAAEVGRGQQKVFQVVSKWNMLDTDSLTAKTVNGFKTKLERERAKKISLFLD